VPPISRPHNLRNFRRVLPLLGAAILLAGCGTGGLVKKGDPGMGKRIFLETLKVNGQSYSCAACHTLAAAGSTGTIGPNLDAAFCEARAQGYKDSAIEDIVAGQIRAPGQYAVGTSLGTLPANMPPNLVSGTDLADVAAFVAQNAGTGGCGAAPTSAAGASGLSVFNGNGCSSCHTLSAAGSHGTIGPDLDKLEAEAVRAHMPLATFVKESIVSPNAYIEPGFPRGVMPQNFGTSLTKAQLSSLVQFLVSSAKKGR
jgi:mono/diheme cytochrome c family protein